MSASQTPCGIEMFARGLLDPLASIGMDEEQFALSGRFDEAPALWGALAEVGALIVNLPMVAWKRRLLMPAFALLAARLRNVRTIVVLHEWSDLDWRRRIVLSLYLLMAQTILFSSPIIRAQFARGMIGWLPFKTDLVPIPPNIARPPKLTVTPLVERLTAEKAKGRLILGHFGSIYPKKRSTLVLDIAAELERSQTHVFVVFIGSFIKGRQSVEAEFRARASALGLDEQIMVTGYIETDAEIFALFDSVDAFVYSFAEGLSSRRGSVLACLQSGRPVVVNAPATSGEFDHHPTFRHAIARPNLQITSTEADAAEFAAAVKAATRRRRPAPLEVFEASWRDAAFSVRAAVAQRAGAWSTAGLRQREQVKAWRPLRSESSSPPPH